MIGLLLLLFGVLIWPLTPGLLGLLLGYGLNRHAMQTRHHQADRLRWRLVRAAWLCAVPLLLIAALYALWWFSFDELALLSLGLLGWATPVPLAAALSLLWRSRHALKGHWPAKRHGLLIAALIFAYAPAAIGAMVAMEQHFEAHAYPEDC